MNEEIEYAEMLEIPVSTVNVVRKKHKRRKDKSLQENLIDRVNEKIAQDKRDFSLTDEAQAENEIADAAETVVLERFEEKTAKSAVGSKILATEFALVCLLCGGIFLTNVFMPTSAINTFFRSVGTEKKEQIVEKDYREFVLASAIGANTDGEISVSPTGVLTVTKKGHIYPVADGKVSNISKNADGSFSLTVGYTSEFCGVISGLSDVYYEEGDSVRANIPVGYSKGEDSVEIALYCEGELLQIALDEENKPTWAESKN